MDVEAAVANLRVAVSLFADMGRLSIAAKHLKDVGELYEKEEKLEASCEAYMQAADLYSGEEVSTTANNCKLKVAELSATLHRYPLVRTARHLSAPICRAHAYSVSNLCIHPPLPGP